MGTSAPSATAATAAQPPIVWPAGVTPGAGRETSTTNAQGQVVQGIVIPFTTSNGTTGSVFIDYNGIHDSAYVQGLIDARVGAVTAIVG